MADNTRNNGLSRAGAGALRGDFSDELGFANRSQMLGTRFAVAGAAFNENSFLDPVSGFGVAPEIFQQVIGESFARPQMVMGVNNAPFRLDNVLGNLGVPSCCSRGWLHVCHSPNVSRINPASAVLAWVLAGKAR